MKKRQISLIICLTILIPFLIGTSQVFAIEESDLLNQEPSLPGRIEKTGTNFEIKDSEYLNISLKSGEEVKVVLESMPRMISLNIDIVSEEINFSLLALEGLEPNATYYLYQDKIAIKTKLVLFLMKREVIAGNKT